jgi:hypothetical protein
MGFGHMDFTREKSRPRLVVIVFGCGGAGGVAGCVCGAAAAGVPGIAAGWPGACACACMQTDAAVVRTASASVIFAPRIVPIILVPFPLLVIWIESTIFQRRKQL